MAPDSDNKISRMKIAAKLDDSEYLKTFLETTSAKLIHSWDGTDGVGNFDILRQYCTGNFTMEYFPDLEFPWPRTNTLEDHLSLISDLKQVNPSWQMRPYNFTAVLDRELDNAVVWFTSGPSGGPGSAGDWSSNRESVSKLKWRKRKADDHWECYCMCSKGNALKPMLISVTFDD